MPACCLSVQVLQLPCLCRGGLAQLSAARQQKMDALILAAAQQPVEEASEALRQLRRECEQINGQVHPAS